MQRRSRLTAFVTVALLASGALVSAALVSAAGGDGLPVPLDASQTGVTAPGAESRYTTVAAGRETIVLRTGVDGGKVERSRVMRGSFTVPAVAYDGSSSGLSGDGRTLVLIRPRVGFPRAKTQFAVLDPKRLRVQRRITLAGDYSFDAISPHGETMYLIEYVDPRDPTAYQVRAYDLRRERLVPEPIVDPEAAPVTMGGAPQTRAMSPDGRWAYTLYDTQDPARPPFIHALDTETGSAACIDLEAGLFNRNLLDRMRLEPSADGSTLTVAYRGEPVAIIDAESFEVSEPTVPRPDTAESEGSGSVPWSVLAIAAFGIAVLLAGATIRRARQRHGAGPRDLEQLVAVEDQPSPVQAQAQAQRKEEAGDCDPVP